jgi:adenylate cyclase
LVCGILIFISEYFLFQQVALLIGRILVFMSASFILCCLIYGYLEYINRQKALAVFGRFLDPKVVLKLLAEKKLTAGQLNKKQMVTVLFSDIRNFTQLSEKHAAEDIVSLLNRYFSEQVNIIFQQKGTLDKFIGDCIMAFWGAPLSNTNHAVDAINAALAMEEQLLAFRQSLPVEMQQFDVGIGIHSGEAVVGLIGAELRSDYTVIGDTVNLSSRIEGLTKNHCRILISEQTKILAEHAFDFIYFGEHEVKGKQEKVKLFQPKRKI